VQAARPSIATAGLQARLLDRPIQTWASEILEIAQGGLQRLGVKNERGETEGIYLNALERLVHEGLSPAAALLAGMRDGADFVEQVVAATRV
jgi:gamma-glutamylcysteine synthetase